FPASPACVAGTANVMPGLSTGTQINQALAGAFPAGASPTAASLMAAASLPTLHDPSRPNFVLLATDGLPSCSGADPSGATLAAIQTLAQANIKTFIIGFGPDTLANPQLLNDMATAGGTARAGAMKYYQANDLTELENAVWTIGGSVISCSYKLD